MYCNQNDKESNHKLIEFLEKEFERVNNWLSFAEAKNGALFAVNIAIMSVLMSNFDKAPIVCTIAMLIFLFSNFVCLTSMFPNTQSRPDRLNDSKMEDLNLLFFGDIEKISTTEEYIDLTVRRYFSHDKFDLTDKLIYDLASEVLINSRITAVKYNKFKYAVKVDVLALVVSAVFFIVA